MSGKSSIINRELEGALKKALKDTASDDTDIKDRVAVLNAAIKWESVKAKMADADFGSHFTDEPEEEEDNE